jgi:nucleotide-binding universal stress UspA family protein
VAAPTPVLVAGYDASELSVAALAHAAVLAGETGLVVVVHVASEAPGHDGQRVHDVLQRDREVHGAAVLDTLLLEGPDELADVEWEQRLAHGDAADRLVEVAGEVDADAIVIGSRGRGRLGALLGSVSHALLQRSDRPVLVVGPRCLARLRAAQAGADLGDGD